MCCAYEKVKGKEVTIPKKTYISVPQSIVHAGGIPVFEDRPWKGVYKLEPFPIYDSAKRLTSDMYIDGTHMCLSFHLKKPLCIGKGGMIITDSKEAYEAARGLWLLQHYPVHAEDQIEDPDYRDITTFPLFKKYPSWI